MAPIKHEEFARILAAAEIERAEMTRSRFDAALAEHDREIASIAALNDAPSFENTILAFEMSGRSLAETGRVFGVLAGACVDDAIQALEREIGPRLSRHFSRLYQNEALFRRIAAIAERAGDDPDLSSEARRLVARLHKDFVRSGAALAPEDRSRLADIDAKLSELGTRFGQNILADERNWTLELGPNDLAGLPDGLVSDLAANAEARGLTGHCLSLSRSLVVPFLTHSERPDLRAKAFEAWTRRGENEGESDNRAIMAEILGLRHEKAVLLGFASYAAFKLDDQMAGTPDRVRDLLMRVWEPARERAMADAEALRAIAGEEGRNTPLAAADWRYFAEKRRRRDFAFDADAIKPYLSLDRMIAAAFDVAGRLFGLTFTPDADAPRWHGDVRAWRVTDAGGAPVGLFLGDYFARPSKRSGAWMSALKGQHKIGEGQRPIIYNVCNFARPRAGEPALLTLDDARTLFHEFGHALHGLLSDVTYPSLAGTAVARDFVELPSQLFEHWLTVPDILATHARHVRTGEPLPEALLAKLQAARNADAGFDTVEYTASAIVDLDLHETADPDDHPLERERATLAAIGMPQEIVMRHRSPHFAHVFSGDGYASGYYSYMWSEVLDADAFEAFGEAGDPFDAETAQRLKRFVYAAGDSEDPAALYERFRGRAPNPDALMRKRGFAVAG